MHHDFVKKTLSIGESITVHLVSKLSSLDSTASLHTNNRMFSTLDKSNLFELEISGVQ